MSTEASSGSSLTGGHLPASPHGRFEKLFDGIWFVRGGVKMPMRMPMRIGRSMTVIRIGGFHGRDDAFYRERYGARVYALEGQVYVRGMDISSSDTFMEPDEWLNEQSTLPIADAKLKLFPSSTPPEAVCLLQREGGILVAGDSLQHTPKPDEYFSFLAKIMMKRMGFFVPYNVGPGWLQFARPTKTDVRSVLELDFEHVLPGHGAPVIGDAKQKYRTVLEGELKGCHAE